MLAAFDKLSGWLEYAIEQFLIARPSGLSLSPQLLLSPLPSLVRVSGPTTPHAAFARHRSLSLNVVAFACRLRIPLSWQERRRDEIADQDQHAGRPHQDRQVPVGLVPTLAGRILGICPGGSPIQVIQRLGRATV
jgi:hypothetical protein